MNDNLKKLREPFPEYQISLLPKPTKKDAIKGICSECRGYHGLPATHLKYVGHAALTDRLLDVDPLWTWEPLAMDERGLPRFDETGGLWIKLTICGHTRLGYGNAEKSTFKEVGAREKEVIGDALRNAAMRFGAALDLWHKGDLHGDDDNKQQEESPTTEAPKAETKNPWAMKNLNPSTDEWPIEAPKEGFFRCYPWKKKPVEQVLATVDFKTLENKAIALEKEKDAGKNWNEDKQHDLDLIINIINKFESENPNVNSSPWEQFSSTGYPKGK